MYTQIPEADDYFNDLRHNFDDHSLIPRGCRIAFVSNITNHVDNSIGVFSFWHLEFAFFLVCMMQLNF